MHNLYIVFHSKQVRNEKGQTESQRNKLNMLGSEINEYKRAIVAEYATEVCSQLFLLSG